MRHPFAKLAALTLAAAGAVSLSGCVQVHLSQNFGVALRQDLAAQIADPDAHYAGVPAPGSGGPRVALAQDRYDKGRVIQPTSTTTTTAGGGGGSGAGGVGGGGGVGVGTQ